jgi:hypothetical protein
MLLPLPYHQATTRYCQQQQEVWRFFTNTIQREEEIRAFKTDLLKNTYQFNRATESALYDKVAIAQQKLDLHLPVTLYQAQHTEEINATIVYAGGEAHLVFSGKLIQLLTEEELLAVIGHELSHILLYTQMNGDVEVADRIITSIANHPSSSPAQYETARLFKLYTEIFCDRGAHLVTGNYQPIVSSLVKLATGLATINAESYVKQAAEIFSNAAGTITAGVSHPENFIRARAIYLWQEQGAAADAVVQQMMEGSKGIDELDLFHQQQLTGITERLVQWIVQPAWMQTPLVMALARQYFSKLVLPATIEKETLAPAIQQLHPSLRDFLSYLLYDFATADKTLEDLPLGYCFRLAIELRLTKHFTAVVKKERKLTDKQMDNLQKKTVAEYQKQGSLLV